MKTMEQEDKWSSASLRIASETMSTGEISRILGMVPSRSFDKGEPVSSVDPGAPRRKEFIWILESGLGDLEPLEAHIAVLVTLVENNITSMKRLFPDCYIDIRCAFSSGSGQGGFVLDAKLLGRLTVLPIDLVVDLFPPAARS